MAAVRLTWNHVCSHLAVTSLHSAGKEPISLLSEGSYRGSIVFALPDCALQLQDFLSPHSSWTVNLGEENRNRMRYHSLFLCCLGAVKFVV